MCSYVSGLKFLINVLLKSLLQLNEISLQKRLFSRKNLTKMDICIFQFSVKVDSSFRGRKTFFICCYGKKGSDEGPFLERLWQL